MDHRLLTEKRCLVYCGECCTCAAGQPMTMAAMETLPETIECRACNGTGRVSFGSLAERLRYLRAAKGVKLRQIPGISSASISQMETGAVKNPSVDKLVILADFFGVTVDWLVGRGTAP